MNINIRPDGKIIYVHVSQNDVGRTLTFNLFNDSLAYTVPTGATVKIQGTKPSGFGFSETCSVNGNVATIDTTEAMTDESGNIQTELSISYGDVVIGTSNFVLAVERNPHPSNTTDGTQITAQSLQVQINQLAEAIESVGDVKHSLSYSNELIQAGHIEDITFEVGGISTDGGSKVERNDMLRTLPYLIDENTIVHAHRTSNSALGSLWSNCHCYDASMSYLGSRTLGGSQSALSWLYQPSLDYPTVKYVVISVLATNLTDLTNINNYYVFDIRTTFNVSESVKQDYDVLDVEFEFGGFSAEGDPYDVTNMQRFRMTKPVKFPKGSRFVIQSDKVLDYQVWYYKAYENGRFIEVGPNIAWTDIQEWLNFELATEDTYIGVYGRFNANYTMNDGCLNDLSNVLKVLIPKNYDSALEKQLLNDVTGDTNLIEPQETLLTNSKIPWGTYGNRWTQVADDTSVRGFANSLIKMTLPSGTYRLFFNFVKNTGSSYSAIGYEVTTSTETLIDYFARAESNYNVEHSFNLSEETTIGIKFKSYVGNVFDVYLYKEPYGTLKTLTDDVNDLKEIVGDTAYPSIYSTPIESLVKKYDATASAGNVGYIWISDLHVNSLYPDRSESLKRQLKACVDIANRTNVAFICIGGDIIDRETSYDTIYELLNDLFDGLKGCRKPIIVLTGNHDDNPYTNPAHLTKEQVKGLFVDMTTVDIIDEDTSKSYYYFDKKGYRFICLDMIDYPTNGNYDGSSWWGFSQEQVEWLANVLLSTNKKTIILCHMSLDESHNTWNLGNGGGYTSDIRSLISAYNSRGSITLYGNTYNYASVSGEIIFNHAGHTHYDEQYAMPTTGIPILVTSCAKNETETYGTLVSGNTYVATNENGGHWNTTGWTYNFYPNREIGTINECTIDVVSIGESTVNVFRLGAGEDRTFTY